MRNAVLFVLVICAVQFFAAPARADSAPPASQPAQLPILKDETPRDALLRGCKVFDTLNVDAAMELFDYSGEDEKALCRLECEYAVAIARVEAVLRKKWGKVADDSFVHALGEVTEDDVKQAKILAGGDRAIVMYQGKPGDPLPMKRVDGVWKVFLASTIANMSPEDVANLKTSLRLIRDGLPKIDEQVKSGKLSSSDDVNAAAKKLSDDASKTEDDAPQKKV